MLRTIAFAATMALTNAIRLETEAEKFAPNLQTPSWETTDAKYKAACAATTKFTDAAFPADKTSLGVANSADIAKGAKPQPDPPIKWRRLSDIYGDKTTLFAPPAAAAKHSSMIQGGLGDCYLLSVLAGLDTRPGTLEALFLQENKHVANKNGVYAMKFWIDGEPVVVTVDDYVPTRYDSVQHKGLNDGAYTDGWYPYYATSANWGEIWPMIAEKAWAKLVGTYKATAGGQAQWVAQHLTDDPTETVMLGKQLTATKAEAAWKQLKGASDRHYLLFTGTTGESWVPSHAYTILSAFERTIDNKPTKLVTLRNPWGETKWNEKASKDKKVWKAANAALRKDKDFKPEGGWFVMTWPDFIKQFSDFSIVHGEESRSTGRKERIEFRPKLKLTGTGK